jgi:hypothetical protein
VPGVDYEFSSSYRLLAPGTIEEILTAVQLLAPFPSIVRLEYVLTRIRCLPSFVSGCRLPVIIVLRMINSRLLATENACENRRTGRIGPFYTPDSYKGRLQ